MLKHGHDHVVVPPAVKEADLPFAPLLHEAAGPIGSNRAVVEVQEAQIYTVQRHHLEGVVQNQTRGLLAQPRPKKQG